MKIYIEPTRGLANRMRALASMFSISKELDAELICIWDENEELNAPFETIFENIEGISFQKKNKSDFRVRFSNQKTIFKQVVVKIVNKLHSIDYCFKEKDLLLIPEKERRAYILETCKKYKSVYIQTCEQYGDIIPYLNMYVPTTKVIQMIHEASSGFSKNMIGIHIRRTDNILSIENSPIELFYDVIDHYMNTNEDVKFFVSTDDLSEETKLKDKFGDKIIVFKKELRRDTLTGIQHAVVDMYCLSKCSVIYGSFWSSFSQMAAEISKIEIKVLTSKTL